MAGPVGACDTCGSVAGPVGSCDTCGSVVGPVTSVAYSLVPSSNKPQLDVSFTFKSGNLPDLKLRPYVISTWEKLWGCVVASLILHTFTQHTNKHVS